MSGKQGQRWGAQKPRIRPADGPRPATEDLSDPAKGEKVPRCRSCGMPDQPTNHLIPGLWSYIRFSMELALCQRCVVAFAPSDPQEADPMQLHDAA